MWLEEQQAWEEEGSYCVWAFAELFWHVAPTVTSPETLHLHPLHLAMTLHNAKLGMGRAPGLESTLRSVNASLGRPNDPLQPQSGGKLKHEAEAFLESVRLEVNPTAPSRLACYFISMDEETAKRRMDEMRGQRAIYPCRVLRDGQAHLADISLFDEIYNAMGYPRARQLAERYWDRSNSIETILEKNLEILVDGSLYFPDWQKFPSINFDEIARWDSVRRACLENGGQLHGWQRATIAPEPTGNMKPAHGSLA